MPSYVLKQYNRPNYPTRSVGVMVHDWSFEAPDLEAAIKLAKDNLLTDYHPPEDFAVLWDDTGERVWDEVRSA
jgi:hypothetical protein